ncbi:hypothetical protein OHA11_06100 [Streptomyces sp. NBC_00878]|nr:hypothetical protein [Streptomyces sp. NBC_00878]
MTDWMAAMAMDSAARASSPVAEGVRPVRTLSVKSASSATYASWNLSRAARKPGS